MTLGVKIKMLRLIIIVSQIITILILAWSLTQIRSCALDKKNGAKIIPVCSVENEVLEVPCPQGETGRILQVCKGGRYEESFRDCKASACSGVTFNQTLKPIIDQNCVSCHAGFNQIETAKAKIEEFIRRVNLAVDDPARMPKAPNQPLDDEEKAKFQGWKDNNFLASCEQDQVNNNPHIDLDYIELAIDQDLSKLTTAQQADSRYLITAHKSNEKANPEVLRQFKNGINKSINSLSTVRNLQSAVAIDQYQVVYRLSLRDLGLKAADWKLIEDNEVINLVSVTNRGLLLRQLTKTRKPWLHVDSFAFTSNEAAIYYQVRKLPAKAQDLFNQTGVEFNQDIDDFEALFVGFETSPISLNKNRLLGRWESNDGSMWVTFDVAQNQGGNSNLFQFPLLRAVNAKNNYQFNAAEFIFSLPNGLHGYFLSDNQGNRQNAAPLNIVADNISPFSPEIKASLSCYRCHSAGFIPAKDQIKAHVVANATQFDLGDVERVELLYREPEPIFLQDNGQYAEALSKIGVLAAEPDPISLVADNLRRNQNAKAVAALLLLTEQEFLDGLARSADGRAQVGQLLTGGSITFEQLKQSLPVIIRDLRIGQEDLIP